MALFPAYRPKKDNVEINNETFQDDSLAWLQNKSCPPEIAVIDLPHSKETSSLTSLEKERTDELRIISKKKHKTKSKKKKTKSLKSHKRKYSSSRSRSTTPSRKRAKKHKHKKQHCSQSSNSDSETLPPQDLESDAHLRIPTHPGLSKGIFVDGPLRLINPQDALYFDREPDRNNSIFCATHYSQVASYKKCSSLPLGTSDCFKFITKKKKRKNIRYFSKSVRVLPGAVTIHSLPIETLNSEYVPVNLTYSEEQKLKKQKTGSANAQSGINALGIFDHATEDYLLGREKPVEVEMPTHEDNSQRKYWQDQVKSFNERLAKEPHNVSLWLEFINIQDKAIAFIFDNDVLNRMSNTKNVKLLTERKLSLLETAINKNIRELKLHLMRLKLGEDIWDTKKLLLEWNKLIHNFPNNMNMWHQYLSFHQTYFPVFHLEKAVLAFAKCLERLVQMQKGTFLSHKPPDHIGYILIDVATQLAFMWYQSGYMERSIALFQALFELNLFCPPHLQGNSMDPDFKIDFFEAFWDSRAPRFGDKDSVGWAKFMEKREPVVFPDEILEGKRDEEDEIILEGGSKHELWLRLESSRDTNHWSPWQQDPENCEDMERDISLPVIRKYLFFTSSPNEIFYLILRFLKFLGVPINGDVMREHFKSLDTSAVDPLTLETLQALISADELSHENLFNFPVIGPSIYKEECDCYIDFICEIITRSTSLVPTSKKAALVIIRIQLYTQRCLIMKERKHEEFRSLVKAYKKNIKGLLKQEEFRSNLDIYYEYAVFESRVGCYEDSLKIHKMALTLGIQSCDILSDTPTSLSLLKHLHALFRLELARCNKTSQGHVNQLLGAVCSLVFKRRFSYSTEVPIGGQILKVKKRLNSCVESGLNSLPNGLDSAASLTHYCVTLLSLLQLLTVGFKPACLVFEEVFDRLSEHAETMDMKMMCNVQERLYKDYLWLIEVAPNLSSCLPMSPLLVRKILMSAISVAPRNVFFLEKLAKCQSWRDILCFHQPHDSDILTIIFRVLPHIKKVVNVVASAEFGAVSSGYQLESILQSAVATTAGKNCPLLWRLYLRLIQTLRPNQLKTVAYRALDSCPYAKCLYMDCVRLVPETMTDILRLMGEKGIRVRLPVEELDVLLEEEKEDCEEEEECRREEMDCEEGEERIKEEMVEEECVKKDVESEEMRSV